MREGLAPRRSGIAEGDLATRTDSQWRAAARASAIPLLSVTGATIAALIADALALTSADERFALVAFGLGLPLLLGHVLRRGARLRVLIGVLGVPWIFALAFPRSPLPLSWLTGGVLSLGLVAVVHAARTAWKLGASTPSRAGLALLAAGPGLYFWVAATVVLVNTQIVVAPVRLAHQSPRIAPHEQSVSFLTRDDYRIEGTYTPGARAAGGVLLVHGVADGRDRWRPWVARLREQRLHVLRIDLRAHGRSDGAVVTYGQREVEDVAGGLAWLRAHPSIDPRALAMVGTSMGGGVVLAASEHARVRAAVALAPASSYGPLVVRRTALLGPLRPFVLNASAPLARAMGQIPMPEWHPAARMSRNVPFLVAHGVEDRTIPIELSRELARTHSNVELFELSCGHDELPACTAADPAWARVRDFLTAQGF